jgi:hypothetical protein
MGVPVSYVPKISAKSNRHALFMYTNSVAQSVTSMFLFHHNTQPQEQTKKFSVSVLGGAEIAELV